MMIQFLDSFNNRDISILIWFFILIISFIISDPEPTIDLIKTVFRWGFVLFTLVIFTSVYSLIVFLLSRISYWNIALLKDTIYWYFVSGISFIFGINKIKSNKEFCTKVFEDVKLATIFKFYLSLYAFPFWAEFIGLPILVLIVSLAVFSEHKFGSNHKVTEKFKLIQNIFVFAILIGIFWTSIKTGHFLEISNLKTFLLPFLLILLISPFFYCLLCLLKYSDLYVDYRNYLNHSKSGYTKGNRYFPFLYAKLNLDKIVQLDKKLDRNYFTKGLYKYEEFKEIIDRIPNK